MVIDFTKKVISILDGKPFTNEDKTEITLLNVACNALFAVIPDEKVETEEKIKRYEIATRIVKEPKLDLKIEEIAKIKELIGKVYSTVIVGATFEMIEPKEEKK